MSFASKLKIGVPCGIIFGCVSGAIALVLIPTLPFGILGSLGKIAIAGIAAFTGFAFVWFLTVVSIIIEMASEME